MRSDTPLFTYVVSLADDALVLGHRLSEWSGRAPMLEEDIALSNLGLDLIGQARLLYAYAGEVEGKGRGEDDLAYLRDEFAYANLLLVEQPNGDFAATMVRQLLYAAFMHLYWQALQTSADARLAEIAAKAVKEMAYHVRHAAEWVIRLGDGTEESHARAAAALEELWMYTGELFEMDGGRASAGAEGRCRRPCNDQAHLGRHDRSRASGGDLAAPGGPLDAGRRPQRTPQRASGPPAGRDAGLAPRPSRRDVVRMMAVVDKRRAPQGRMRAISSSPVPIALPRPSSIRRSPC